MKRLNILVIIVSLLGFISGCESYEDYIEDYDFTAVYFGSQKPLRTVVARDPMQIKFGVSLGGVRMNKQDQWVKFRLEPELLQSVAGAGAFTLLPKDYYEMELPGGDSVFIIPAGKVIGDVTLKLKESFTTDPLAIHNTYALPIRILKTSADSILSNNEMSEPKDYTILVIKYIAKESGVYYVKGSETDVEAGERINYSFSDLIKNKTRDLKTLSVVDLEMGGLGSRNASDVNKLVISLGPDNSATVTTAAGALTVTDLGSSYDPVKRTFRLKYSYVDGAKTYQVDEEIIQRQDPELDLRFEEW